MGRVTIRLAESALTDLESLRAWYGSQGIPEVADRLIQGVLARIENLSSYPDMGRIVPEFSQPFLRELIWPPFRIVYRREPNQVSVVRVWRSERLLDMSGDDSP